MAKLNQRMVLGVVRTIGKLSGDQRYNAYTQQGEVDQGEEAGGNEYNSQWCKLRFAEGTMARCLLLWQTPRNAIHE